MIEVILLIFVLAFQLLYFVTIFDALRVIVHNQKCIAKALDFIGEKQGIDMSEFNLTKNE